MLIRARVRQINGVLTRFGIVVLSSIFASILDELWINMNARTWMKWMKWMGYIWSDGVTMLRYTSGVHLDPWWSFPQMGFNSYETGTGRLVV